MRKLIIARIAPPMFIVSFPVAERLCHDAERYRGESYHGDSCRAGPCLRGEDGGQEQVAAQ